MCVVLHSSVNSSTVLGEGQFCGGWERVARGTERDFEVVRRCGLRGLIRDAEDECVFRATRHRWLARWAMLTCELIRDPDGKLMRRARRLLRIWESWELGVPWPSAARVSRDAYNP